MYFVPYTRRRLTSCLQNTKSVLKRKRSLWNLTKEKIEDSIFMIRYNYEFDVEINPAPLELLLHPPLPGGSDWTSPPPEDLGNRR